MIRIHSLFFKKKGNDCKPKSLLDDKRYYELTELILKKGNDCKPKSLLDDKRYYELTELINLSHFYKSR